MAYRMTFGRVVAAMAASLSLGLALSPVLTAPAYAQFVCTDASNSTGGATAPGQQSVACGTNATAAVTGTHNTAFGNAANAGLSADTAIGGNSTANGGGSTAVGYQSTASGSFSVAVGGMSSAVGTYATAAGHNSSASGFMSSAYGYQSVASGYASTAIGNNNTSTGSNSNSVGTFNTVNGNNSSAFGGNNTVNNANQVGWGNRIQIVGSNNTVSSTASASGSSVVGYNNTVNATNAVAIGNAIAVTGANGIAMGNGAQVAGADGIALGTGTSAGFANSVAIGNGATTTRANQQSFGTSTSTYTMSGITSSASKAAQSGPTQIVTSDGAGNLATTTLASLGIASNNDISTINSQLASMQTQINDNRREARAGTALALAASRLQFDSRPGKISLSAALGHFKGETGLATGIGYAFSDRLKFNAAFSGAPAIGDYGASMGMSLTLN